MSCFVQGACIGSRGQSPMLPGRGAATLLRCASSSPEAPASSAPTSCAGSPRQGTEVAVLDKLTYAGNPANLEGIEHEFFQGDIADPEAVARAAAGCEAIVNFAAETHVDRSILGPQEFVHTDVLGTMCLLEWARANDARYVQVSTDEVYGDFEAGGRAVEDDPLRPSSPYSAAKAGGDLQVLAYCPHLRRPRLDHARRQHLRAEPVSREARAALRHERARG